MDQRRSGILLHITSLPSVYGIGDFGETAFRFADFLAETRQTYWQVLPLNPISLASGSSPYASYSAFAGNTLLISPEKLVDTELLKKSDLSDYPSFPDQYVDFKNVLAAKKKLFRTAYGNFKNNSHEIKESYETFCSTNGHWLHDFACFMAFKSHFDDQGWGSWPEEIKHREPPAFRKLENELVDDIEYQKFMQYIFFRQWEDLKSYCNEKGIQIIGDIPYYVNFDSAEVWKNSELFKLDAEMKPAYIAGVPPDYFSETGQLWGNPVYDWEEMKKQDFQWWISRIEQTLKLYDIVRIDHFRGFQAYWEVPGSETTAINGQWTPAPGDEVFQKFKQKFPDLPILAEDLGVITDDVRELMRKYELPGMRILLFAFGEELPRNSYAPHNHIQNCVVYTGTHDNNTTRGWYLEETTEADRKRINAYLGKRTSEREIHQDFIRLAMMSVANTVIFPMQDILGLGSEYRMNRPATLNGNWKWRMLPDQLTPEIREMLKSQTILFGRS